MLYRNQPNVSHIITRLFLFTLIITAVLTLLLSGNAHAGSGSVSGTQIKWHPITIDFAGPTFSERDSAPNPFLDYRLNLTLTAPSGTVTTVPGFFAGDGNGGGSGNVWRVRFAPDEVGTWQYEASFRQGNNVAVELDANAGTAVSFNSASGSFQISSLDANALGFLRWGRLEYVNQHYLKFADGSYWIKGGIDSPENFLGYGDFDNTVDLNIGCLGGVVHQYAPHVADWQTGDPTWSNGKGKGIIGALNYLSSQNVNSIYFLPMNLGGDGCDTYPFVGPSGSDFDNTHYDISKLHQWNIVLNHAQEKGIAPHFVLAETEPGNTQWLDDSQLGVERKLYYRELIARFGYLLTGKWNLSEENVYAIAQLHSFADYIQALDWSGKPIAVHTQPNNFRDYNVMLGDGRFSATAIQYEPALASDHVETWRANSANANRPWVLDMDENNPAGIGLTSDNAGEMRKQALYDVYFSGGNIEWYFGYHALPLGGDLRTEDFRTREEMFGYMWHARRFMQEHLPFWEMTPVDGLLTGESGDFGGGEVFAKVGEIYAIYLPKANPTGALNLNGISGEFTLQWYNPRTGVFAGSTRTISGGSNISLGPPPNNENGDWVVLIKRPFNCPSTPTLPAAPSASPAGAHLLFLPSVVRQC